MPAEQHVPLIMYSPTLRLMCGRPGKKDKRRKFTAQEKRKMWQQQEVAGGGTVICPRCNNTIHSSAWPHSLHSC